MQNKAVLVKMSFQNAKSIKFFPENVMKRQKSAQNLTKITKIPSLDT
jgi:hypothetical protein